MRMKLSVLLLMLLGRAIFGQEPLETKVPGELNILRLVEEVKKYEGEVRELRVLAPTLAPEEIDRAVLNKLMQEIIDDPELTEDRFAVSAERLIWKD